MKVALLNPVFWPEVRRGSERFAYELARGLIAAGHEPVIITSHPGRTTRTVEDGIAIHRLWRPPQERLRRRMYEPWLTHAALTARELRRVDPDVAHALYPTDGAVAARWGGPSVLSYMGLPHRASLANRRLRLRLTLEAVHGCDAVVALSDTAAEHFDRWLGVEARVIAPGVDLEEFTPDPAARAEQPTILCTADASEPRKRVDLLVEAFALVRQVLPNARLVLDGDRTVPLPQANREAWVAVLPSWGEAFGLVLLEALASGTPAVGPNAELIDSPRIGRVFDGDDPAALASALLSALDLSRNPMTADACRRRAEQFSWKATTDAYLALYRELGAS